MSDLTPGASSQPVRLEGANSSGTPTGWVASDANGNILTRDYSDGPVTPGTVATTSTLAGGQFNTALPTVTNTEQVALQVDASGRLIVAPLTNSSIVKAQLQDNSGTAITLGQKVMASSIPVVIASDQTRFPVEVQDGSGNAITSTTINSKQRLDVDLAAEAADGSTAPFNTLQVGGKDPSGNLQAFITLTTGEQFVRDVLNVGAQSRAQSVTTTAAEALGAATILANRKLIHITPTNGIIYWGYTSGVTTATGSPLLPNNTLWLSVTDNVHVFLIAAATTDVRIGELS